MHVASYSTTHWSSKINIFIVARNPVLAAQMLCDRHVVKMPLESVQMLCTVYRQYVPHFIIAVGELYLPSHTGNQITKWVGYSASNYRWLVDHAAELFAEYSRRYGKVHASSIMFERVREVPHTMQDHGLTPFTQAMPEQYKGQDAIAAYRRYYVADKVSQPWCEWKRGSPCPYWAEDAYHERLSRTPIIGDNRPKRK